MNLLDFFKKSGIETGLVYVSLGNMSAVALGSILWLLLAYFLQTGEYGQINYAVSAATFASTISILGLNVAIMTLLKGQPDIKNQANTLILVSTALTSAPLLLIVQSVYVVLLMVTTTTFVMSSAIYLGSQQYRSYALLLISQKIIQIVLGIGLFFIIGENGVLWGYIVSYLVMSFVFIKSIRKLSFSNLIEIKNKKSFIFHSYSLEIGRAINMHSDKLLIGPIFGFSILGIYQFASQFLLFLGILPAILYNYLLPSLDQNSRYKKIYTLSLGLAIIAAMAVFFVAPTFVTRIFGNFTESIEAIRILVWGIIPMTITSILSSKFLANNNSRPVFISALFYMVTQVLSVLILGEALQVLGISIGIILALSVQCLYLVVKDHKQKFSNITTISSK